MKLNAVEVLVYDDASHVYTLNGKMIPGVTTICDLLPKPWLMPWAKKTVTDYLSQVWGADKTYTAKEIETHLAESKRQSDKFKNKAADIGKIVHSLCEAHIGGKGFPKLDASMEFLAWVESVGLTPPKIEELGKMMPLMQTRWDMFLGWEKEVSPKWLYSEQVVVSSKYEYAGTLDFICEIGGELVLGDVKTSGSWGDTFGLQTAGYIQAVSEMGGEDIKKRLIIWMPEKKPMEVVTITSPLDFDLATFLHMREVQKYVSYRKNNKEVR